MTTLRPFINSLFHSALALCLRASGQRKGFYAAGFLLILTVPACSPEFAFALAQDSKHRVTESNAALTTGVSHENLPMGLGIESDGIPGDLRNRPRCKATKLDRDGTR